MNTEDRELLAQDKRWNKTLSIVSVLLGLAIIAAGVFAYLWMHQSSEATSLRETVSGNSKEIELLKKQTSDSTAEISDKPNSNPSGETQPAPNDDSTSIVQMVGAYAHARTGDENAKLTIAVTKKQLPFTRVSVGSEEGGGYACVLKKSDNLWIVLFCGQGVPMQSDLDQWGVPASMVEG